MKNIGMYVHKYLIVILVLIFAVACGDEEKTELVLKNGADESIILNQTETVTVDSVKVTVSSDAWVGAPDVKTAVTPLRIKIENTNTAPVKITYDNLRLVSGEGDVYAALPIYNLIDSLDYVTLSSEHKVVVKSEIDHDRFYLYPLYTRVYNDIPITDYEYFEDPGYYTKYYAEWNETGMPTPTMRNLALPEGILDTGGSISGFVYFQKVDLELETVKLNMGIVNAENNEVLGTIELPFWVMYEKEE